MNRQYDDDQLVRTRDQIVENFHTFNNMASGSEEERKFHDNKIKNIKLFVAVSAENGWHFAPKKWCGYLGNELHRTGSRVHRDERKANNVVDQILGKPVEVGDYTYVKINDEFLDYCAKHLITPSSWDKPRRYWLIDITDIYPDEISDKSQFSEGAAKSVRVNRFERDPAARAACIAHFGHNCKICGFDFFEIYGDIGRNFIHVHHLIPLSEIGQSYEVDPIKDLLPVCPNCHAMLHRRSMTIDPSTLKAILGRA